MAAILLPLRCQRMSATGAADGNGTRGSYGGTVERGVMGVSRALRFVFARIEVEDHRHRRLLGILQGVVTSLGNRAITVLVTFLSVPLTIHYLGAERYGAWATIGSLLAWLALTDFGLGNGLSNAITTAAGQDRPDLVRVYMSSGIAMLTVVASATALILALAWPWIDWASLLGVSTPDARAEVGPAVAASLAIFLLRFPLSVSGKIYLAYHEGRIGNYWGVTGNVATLATLLIVTQTEGGLVWLVVAVSGINLLVGLINAVWLFVWHRPEVAPALGSVRLSSMRELGNTSGRFFLLQITALLVFQTDNLVVAHFLGAAQVPSYSVTHSLFTYTTLLQAAVFTYLWPAYTEAIARRDIAWVRRVFNLDLAGSVAFSSATAAVLIVIAKPFILWWAGPAAEPSTGLVWWMAAWSVIDGFTSPIACLLAAAAHIRAQIVYSALAALCNIALSVTLVQTWGVTGVIAGTVISYAVLICIPTYVDARSLLRKLSRAA